MKEDILDKDGFSKVKKDFVLRIRINDEDKTWKLKAKKKKKKMLSGDVVQCKALCLVSTRWRTWPSVLPNNNK